MGRTRSIAVDCFRTAAHHAAKAEELIDKLAAQVAARFGLTADSLLAAYREWADSDGSE